MRIKGRDAVLQKVVLEVRYRRGFTYLDKCGRTLNALMSQFPEWTQRDEGISPQNAPLVSLKNGCILNFSSLKYDFSLEMKAGGDPLDADDTSIFKQQCSSVGQMIAEELGLREFSRIGFRAWYLFSCSNQSDARKWLSDLGVMSVSDELRKAFGPTLESASFAVVFASDKRKYRVAFNEVERTAQVDCGQSILNIRASQLPKHQREFLGQQLTVRKRLLANPEFAVMIDIDAHEEDPQRIDADSFIESSLKSFTESLTRAIK